VGARRTAISAGSDKGFVATIHRRGNVSWPRLRRS
jgi:hypothetical protein